MNPFEYLNAINYTKQNVMVDDLTEKAYNAFKIFAKELTCKTGGMNVSDNRLLMMHLLHVFSSDRTIRTCGVTFKYNSAVTGGLADLGNFRGAVQGITAVPFQGKGDLTISAHFKWVTEGDIVSLTQQPTLQPGILRELGRRAGQDQLRTRGNIVVFESTWYASGRYSSRYGLDPGGPLPCFDVYGKVINTGYFDSVGYLVNLVFPIKKIPVILKKRSR